MTKEINDMLTEMIRFLQKWGMWKQKWGDWNWNDTMILTGGKKFESSDSESDTYEGIPYVAVTQPVDSEEYAEDSERLFDLKCCRDLYYLLHPYGELSLPVEQITDEAWNDLFERGTIIDDYLNDLCADEYDKFIFHALVDGSDDQYTFWDPLEYESFEEYRQIYGDDGNGTPIYRMFETYEDYKRFLAGDISLIRNDPPLYRLLAKAVKQALMDDGEELRLTKEMTSQLKKEFDDIYEKHGLTYEDSDEGGALLIGRLNET